jgi:hypothetical protein
MMSWKAVVVFLASGVCALGLCALVASETSDPRARLRVRHVKETTIVSAGNRRLAGFFDGLTPDPHWDGAKLLHASGRAPECGAGRNRGMLARLASFLVGTVHAQGGCGTTTCGGHWTGIDCVACTGGDCGMSCNVSDGPNYCIGTQQDGTQGCSGVGGCPGTCNSGFCTISNCTCISTGAACTSSDTCCGFYASCISGTCQDIE